MWGRPVTDRLSNGRAGGASPGKRQESDGRDGESGADHCHGRHRPISLRDCHVLTRRDRERAVGTERPVRRGDADADLFTDYSTDSSGVRHAVSSIIASEEASLSRDHCTTDEHQADDDGDRSQEPETRPTPSGRLIVACTHDVESSPSSRGTLLGTH